MVSFNRLVGIIITGIFSLLGWCAIAISFGFLVADISNYKERDIIVLALMLTARSVTNAI